MEYNTQRKKLPMPEYGRGIQNMVDFACSLPTKEERQRCAQTIVSIMGNMFPHLRDVPDFKHKLWDHLAIMSNYELDIDYPYEIEKIPEEGVRPQPLPYPMQKIRYRHYGHLLETLIKKMQELPEGPEREELSILVAAQMKRSLANWNKDAMDDEKIIADLKSYTQGEVELNMERFQVISNFLSKTMNAKGSMMARGNGKKSKKRNN